MPSLEVVVIVPHKRDLRSTTLLFPLSLAHLRKMWLSENTVRGKKQETAQNTTICTVVQEV